MITASAYAVVLPFNTNEDIISRIKLDAIGVPVIAVKNSVINEVAKTQIICRKKIKDIGEKMMQLYKDENYRSYLIEKGRQVAATFTNEKTAEILWQSIMKVLE